MLVACFANNAVLGASIFQRERRRLPWGKPDLMPGDLVLLVEEEKAIWKPVYLVHGSDTCSVGHLKQARQDQMPL